MDEVEKLFDEVTAFLISCGGIYHTLSVGTQKHLLFCITTGQYLLYRDAGGLIEHFLCYWKVAPEDVKLLQDGITPTNRVSGSVLYIVEHGNKAGRKGMWRAIKDLRERCHGMAGLVFNHKGEGLKHYPSQKGA